MFPLLAIEDDGRVHYCQEESSLSEFPELFIHGEITYVVDIAGTEYRYSSGDLAQINLHAAGAAEPQIVIDAVWSRMGQLVGTRGRTKNELLSRPMDRMGLEMLRRLPPSELGRAFLLAAIYQLD